MRGAPRCARRNSTRRHGWGHGINHRDMFIPEDRLMRHESAAEPATATCTRPADPRLSDMFLPQDRLLRHVTRQPTPLQRHVLSAEPATATCARPAGSAPATCSSRRTGYCDMYPASRHRSSDMFAPEDRLLRHVPGRPAPLQRHIPPAGPATATCARPAGPAPATCSSRRTRYCDMYPASRPGSSDMFFPEDPLLRHVPGRRARSSDMFFPEDPLLRHVRCQPTPLQRHVPPAGSATATCDSTRLPHLGAAFQAVAPLRRVEPGRPTVRRVAPR